ncbi:hypothetical protein [Kribbella sindirgiensis]|uniref:Uncharacterized protein n=1 Tax=Kribbella sindirgiensis TaxID=1124744 RepID=A0A4R0I479_9ACTN|nr:hypothetical protein [Kribbella sindirgiensis]TCC19248.1 hypothetical protein E0H50_38105 [Kribbella sindirgiensis]
MNADEELLRLLDDNPRAAREAGVQLSVESADSALLLERCREVMVKILQHGEEDWPDLPVWQRELPAWFVLACGPERTQEEADAKLIWWRGLSPGEQMVASEVSRWALSDWLWWLEPENRTWYWLGADVVGAQHLLVHVEIDGAPAPIGALRWLLKAAGATEIEEY